MTTQAIWQKKSNHLSHPQRIAIGKYGFLRNKTNMIVIKQQKIHTFSASVFQHRMIESRPAEYNRPVLWSNWSAFTPDRWRGSSSSLITNDIVTFLLCIAWLWGWPCECPEGGRTPAAILHFSLSPFIFVSKSSQLCSLTSLRRDDRRDDTRALGNWNWSPKSTTNGTNSSGELCEHNIRVPEVL